MSQGVFDFKKYILKEDNENKMSPIDTSKACKYPSH